MKYGKAPMPGGVVFEPPTAKCSGSRLKNGFISRSDEGAFSNGRGRCEWE